MPDVPESESSNPGSTEVTKAVTKAEEQQQSSVQHNETVSAHLMQIMGANRYRPTEAQVDKMLALQ